MSEQDFAEKALQFIGLREAAETLRLPYYSVSRLAKAGKLGPLHKLSDRKRGAVILSRDAVVAFKRRVHAA